MIVNDKLPLKDTDPLLPHRLYIVYDPPRGFIYAFTSGDGKLWRQDDRDDKSPIGRLERTSYFPGDWLGNKKGIYFKYDYTMENENGKKVMKHDWSMSDRNPPIVGVRLWLPGRIDEVTDARLGGT